MFQCITCQAPGHNLGWIVFKGTEVHCVMTPPQMVPEILCEDEDGWFELPAMVVTLNHFNSIFTDRNLGFTNCRPSLVNQPRTIH
jgi:hypothetical protein